MKIYPFIFLSVLFYPNALFAETLPSKNQPYKKPVEVIKDHSETLEKHQASSPRPPSFQPPKITDLESCRPMLSSAAIQDAFIDYIEMIFLLNEEGVVTESRILLGSGSKTLDEETLGSLSKCKFEPAEINGVLEKSWLKLRWILRPTQALEYIP